MKYYEIATYVHTNTNISENHLCIFIFQLNMSAIAMTLIKMSQWKTAQPNLLLALNRDAGKGWRSGRVLQTRMWCYGTSSYLDISNSMGECLTDCKARWGDTKDRSLSYSIHISFFLSLRFLTYLPLIIEISNLKIENNWLRKKKESQLTRRVYIKFKLQDLVP